MQDGSGFPYIAPPIYAYLCDAELSTIKVTVEDIPEFQVRALIEEVRV